MPKKTTTASTWKNKANKSRKETDLERATKRAQAVLGNKVVFCEKCNKPKMPDILRTGNPEREKGFCKCWVDSLYEERYCTDIVLRFKQKKDKILTNRSYYEPSGNVSWETPDGYDHGGLKSEKITKILADFPTFEERSTMHEILERTRQDWVNMFPEFARACEMCKQIQYYILLKWGLNWTFNANVVKLLGAQFGLSEVIKVATVTPEVTEEQMERIDKLLARNYQSNGEDD